MHLQKLIWDGFKQETQRGSEEGAWRDCTLFGVITLSLEDVCVYSNPVLFSVEFWKKNRSVTSLGIGQKLMKKKCFHH